MKRFFLTLLVGGIYMLSGAPLAAFTLTYTAGPGGTISGKTPQTVLAGKTGTAVKAVPMAQCRFVHWSDNHSTNPLRTDGAADLATTAVFDAIAGRYMLSYRAGVGGTISGTATQTVLQGLNGTMVKAVPKAGYHFVKWSDQAGEFKPPFNRQDLAVQATKIVTAEFAVTEVTKLVVLKGVTTDTVHYVYNGSATEVQEAELGVVAVTLAAKPKVYYFLVATVTYTPQMTAVGVWTGEGNLLFETMGAVEYGVGRHRPDGVWGPKLAYAYNIGTAVDFAGGGFFSSVPKLKTRTGVCDINAPWGDAPPAGWVIGGADDKLGVGELVYAAAAVTDKLTGNSQYNPTISSLIASYSQLMALDVGLTTVDAQFGAGKVAFVQDTALTTTANLIITPTNANGHAQNGVRAGKVVEAINAFLLKNNYPLIPANTDLDPLGWYPFP